MINPQHEMRNTKQSLMTKIQDSKIMFRIRKIEILNLFRILEIRI